MSLNRLTRDQVIGQALDAADSPSLDQRERPDGVTITGTNGVILGANWLQRAIDFMIKHFPIRGTLVSTTGTIPAGSPGSPVSISIPSDYVQDYLNGILITTTKPMDTRLVRRGYSYLLSMTTIQTAKPTNYAVRDDSNIEFRPIPDKAYPYTLFYYKFPAVLAGTDIPVFPDDQVLIDFLEIRYKEWLGAVPKGTSLQYMRDQVASLQRAGFGTEAEPDQIELDKQYFGGTADWMGRNDWMGNTTLTSP